MKTLMKLRNKKGFTLIEVIVVLVIIAILAAATIPAMIGFINDARGKAFAAEARVGLLAAQAAVTEEVASGRSDAATTYAACIAGTNTTFNNMIADLTGVFSAATTTLEDDRVIGIVYTITVGNREWVVTIESGLTTVTSE